MTAKPNRVGGFYPAIPVLGKTDESSEGSRHFSRRRMATAATAAIASLHQSLFRVKTSSGYGTPQSHQRTRNLGWHALACEIQEVGSLLLLRRTFDWPARRRNSMDGACTVVWWSRPTGDRVGGRSRGGRAATCGSGIVTPTSTIGKQTHQHSADDSIPICHEPHCVEEQLKKRGLQQNGVDGRTQVTGHSESAERDGSCCAIAAFGTMCDMRAPTKHPYDTTSC